MDNIFQVPLAGDVGPKTKNDSLVQGTTVSTVHVECTESPLYRQLSPRVGVVLPSI